MHTIKSHAYKFMFIEDEKKVLFLLIMHQRSQQDWVKPDSTFGSSSFTRENQWVEWRVGLKFGQVSMDQNESISFCIFNHFFVPRNTCQQNYRPVDTCGWFESRLLTYRLTFIHPIRSIETSAMHLTLY